MTSVVVDALQAPELSEAVAAIASIEAQLADNPVFQAQRDSAKFSLYVQQGQLQQQAEQLRAKLRHSQLASFREEAK